MRRCHAEDLRQFATTILEAIGTRPDDAAFTADVIVASDLAGHESHGMRRVSEYVERTDEGILVPGARPRVDLDLGALLRLDGQRGFGHVNLREVTDLAIERARAHGICGVALHNSSHAGRIADFCARGARGGVAILFWVNDSGGGQDVAPYGGDAPRLATNPIGVGLPRAAEPHLVLDMSTSVVAKGRLSEWRDRGAPVPADWLTPAGAIRPSGGYKGTGLAVVAEALAGILTGAGFVTSDPPRDDQGAFCIAIDIARLRPLDAFTAEMEEMLGYVRDVPLEPGHDAVRFPGESGALAEAERLRDGVPVQDFTWRRLETVAERFGVALPPLV